MKVWNKRVLQQIAFNHSLNIGNLMNLYKTLWILFKGSMNLYKKYTAKPYSFLIIDATLALDNLLRFVKNLTKNIKPNHDDLW